MLPPRIEAETRNCGTSLSEASASLRSRNEGLRNITFGCFHLPSKPKRGTAFHHFPRLPPRFEAEARNCGASLADASTSPRSRSEELRNITFGCRHLPSKPKRETADLHFRMLQPPFEAEARNGRTSLFEASTSLRSRSEELGTSHHEASTSRRSRSEELRSITF